MKYILSWLFDYIELKTNSLSEKTFNKIIKILSNKVAEVEYSYKIKIDLDNLFLTNIKKIKNNQIEAYCFHNRKNIILKNRDDALLNHNYLIFYDKKNNNYEWATTKNFLGEKETILPAFEIKNSEIKNWKKYLKKEDYIISIDNKSIGHRQDLWGHKGLAREIACHLNLKFKEDKNNLKIEKNDQYIKIKNKDNCSYFSLIKDIKIKEKNSNLKIASRLAILNIKPISYLIDLSNYVMLEIGQPLHVFDSNNIHNFLEIKDAKKDEFLTLRDLSKIKLNEKDLIIYDNKNILTLAGIIGGKDSSVLKTTESISVEAAVFNKEKIRNMSKYHGIRTESSTRFEKGKNSETAIEALNLFYKIIKKEYKYSEKLKIIYSGEFSNEKIIKIDHNFIEKIIGIKIQEKEILNIGIKLGYKIKVNKKNEYKVTVPFWRNDISIKEDFVEDLSRSIGYDNIKIIPLIFEPKGYLFNDLIIKIKDYSVNIFKSHEIYSYGISNDLYEKELEYFPKNFIELKNGYSDIQKNLITSLVPNLIEALKIQLFNGKKEISIFEISSIFKKNENNEINEFKNFSIIFYSENSDKYNFYNKKNIINNFLLSLNIDNKIVWKNETNKPSYYSEISSAIFYNNKKIGYSGFLNPETIFNIFKKKGSIFIFEINLNSLNINKKVNNINYNNFDLSFLIKKDFSTFELIEKLKNNEKNIGNIEIIDFFKKDEWIDQNSITIRIFYFENFEQIYLNSIKILEDYGCILRK